MSDAASPITSFRALIARMEADGELARVTRTVDPRLELIAVTRKMHLTQNRALLFDSVQDSPGPVATNLLCRRDHIATALGHAPDALLPALEAGEIAPLDPVDVKNAPVQEVVLTDGVDVSRDLPQVVHCQEDGGAYISAGIVLARHPETGTYNASWNRVQLAGGDHTRVRMMPPQHLGQYHAVAEAAGKPLPVAIAIGAPPALMLSASSKIPFDSDELSVAGGWQREPLRMVPAKTVPVMVPADAEYIIEGEVLAGVREEEGPFGEFTDTYVEAAPNHVMKVSAITRRKDAIYHAMLAGGAEDLTMLGLNLQVEVLKRVKAFAEIVDISTPGHIFGCVVAMKKRSDEQARHVLMAALAAHAWMKMVVVVDEDVDIHDLREVIWAMQTRCRPDTGLFHIPRLGSFPRADVREVHKGKVGFDATVPMDLRDAFVRRRFPDMEGLNLKDYIG
jgi:2,5-furandicarboxylate decarboxylase 1